VHGDAREWLEGNFDLAAGVGGPLPLQELARLARRGGLVLLGGAYWRRPPSVEYLAALGSAAGELTDEAGIAAAADRLGLELVCSVLSSVADLDRYEDAWAATGRRYAGEHSGEPGVAEFAAWIENGRRRYRELGGRETMGFGLFLFRRG
jgi:hypothetical protein